VDPNPDGGDQYGVGDATIIKIDATYYLFSDIEWKGAPYRVIAWKTAALDEPFEYLGVAAAPRSGTRDWDNHRVQDAEVAYVPEIERYVMFVNMLDRDGSPGGDFPTLGRNASRVIGVFVSEFKGRTPMERPQELRSD
jgi:hypothetical protein